jgi:putative Holliday junction resolvase
VRLLGIDLGSKRIGVSVSDRSGTIASPLTVITRGKSQRVDHDEIARLVRDEEAEGVVVGLPLNMDGSEGPAAVAARQEVERMTTVVGVPVFLHDERRSTVQADQSMSQRNMNAVDRRAVVDKVAAAFILQSWLDSHRKDAK